MTENDDVEHRARHTAPGEKVEVRDVDTEERDGAWFAIRMPISSTAEARDGDAFTRDRLEGWQRQINEGTVPVFADHGRNDDVAGSRYSAFGKFGFYDNAELTERDGETDLFADTLVLDPADLPEETGEYRRHLAILKAQAEAGMPITASVGWSDDTGDRDVPGGSDLLEGSVVGIPSDARADATASEDPAAMARAVSAASSDFDVETFVRELRAHERDLPNSVVEELGDLLVPNAGAVEAAEQAIQWAEEYPDEFALGSGDGEGLRRARQLVDHSDERLDGESEDGVDYWTEIANFHSRHHAQDNHELDEEFEGEPWRDAGYVAHKAWGGDAGYSQAQEVVAALEALADDDDVAYSRSRNLDDPEFATGDAVQWSSNDTTVRGLVADVGDEFEPADGVVITGEDGEAVYLIHELDDSLEPPQYRRENVAKPESSLDESQADLPPLEGNFADEENDMSEDDTEPDGESGTDTDEEETRMDAEEFRESMLEMQQEQTELLREMREEGMDDEDEDEDDGDEEGGDMDESSVDASEDADESGRNEEPDGERTVTLDGEEMAVDEARDHIADLRSEADEADVEEPDTRDFADDGDSDNDQSSGFGMAAHMED